MKLKSNQSGVAHILAVAVVVLIVVIGFAGWKVWDAQDGKKETTQKDGKQVTTSCTEGYKLETNTNMNIRFCLPADWKSEYRTYSDMGTRLLYITSPDHKDAYHGGTDTGTKITITTHVIDENHPVHKDILYTKYSKNVSATTVAGREGVSFVNDSGKGGGTMYIQFEDKGMIYLVLLDEDVSGSSFNDNLDKYQNIVDTLSLIN